MISDMTDYIPIPCSDYEILELACMDQYLVEIAVGDGEIIGQAAALDVRAGEEFFVLEKNDGTTQAVRVDRIAHMKVVSRPARFNHHSFIAPSDS